MCQISINSEHFQFWNNLGLNFVQISINSDFFFHFGTNWGLAIGKDLIKRNTFNIKIEIGVFEISNVLNFSKF